MISDSALSDVTTKLEDINVKELEESCGKREWQNSISSAQREKYVRNFHNTLSKIGHKEDPQIAARNFETAFFNMAESRADYYYLIAEKLYQLQNSGHGKN